MKIDERVSVVEMIEGVFVAQVFDGVSGMFGVGWADTYVGPNKQRAETCKAAILAAMHLYGVDVRKRCAEEAEGLGENCVAAAIRALEL